MYFCMFMEHNLNYCYFQEIFPAQSGIHVNSGPSDPKHPALITCFLAQEETPCQRLPKLMSEYLLICE